MPKGKSFEQLNQLVKNKSLANRVVFSIKTDSLQDIDDLKDSLIAFSVALKEISGNYLTDIKAIRPDIELEVYEYFYSNFPLLIDTNYYRYIDNKLVPDSIKSSVNTGYRQLVLPGSAFTKQFIVNDPLFITSKFFQDLNEINNSSGYNLEEGVLFNKDKSKVLITAKTSFGPGNSEANIELYNLLEDFKSKWNNENPNNELDYFGTFQIAAENAIQIKKDSIYIGSIALGLILLILIFYYRKFSVPIYFILPAIFGGLFALGVTGFIRPDISAISLSTGSILFGIILDFSFHFFTHLKHTGSISTTVKEISAPLLTGSFTTVVALAALIFTNSVILQDFGLFAALSLLGAAVFTITGLPVILKIFRFNYSAIPDNSSYLKLPVINKKYRGFAFLILVILTFFFLSYADETQFDAELENLSYHPESLKNKEQELTDIDPKKEKRIYVFAEAASKDEAAAKNYKVYEKLLSQRNQREVKSFVSAAQVVVPENIKKERELKWKNYWENKRKGTVNILNNTADSLGFDKTAFENFNNLITGSNQDQIKTDSIIHWLELDNFIEETPEKTTFISTVTIENKNLDKVKSELREIPGVIVFDRAETTASLLELVKDDFNYIFWISSLVVFVTLLVIYGRIELALLAFFPMVISWIWILGISALAGIKFNFVNIVISTFIFGLGDDFSIFVNDGRLNRYKYKKNSIASYNSAILLSAITTIIGTGVLIFAKHPAINSIAIVSVLGIFCILIISLFVQPFLFGFFVQKRIDRKRSPIAFFPFLISVFEFVYFISGCLLLYIVVFLLIIFPGTRKAKAKILNSIMSFFSKTVIYLGIHVRKNIFDIKNLDLKNPSIIIVNHSSFLDILLVLMLSPKIIIMVKEWVYRSPLFGYFVRYAGYIYSETGAERNLDKIKRKINEGYSIAIFPEGTRSPDGKIMRFHKGAFYLAQELKLDVTPVMIHGAHYVLPKNDYYVKPGSLNIKVLPRIKSNDHSWGETYRERTKSISKYFKEEYVSLKNERENAGYLWKRIFNNYIFKGPVLEWYLRIKWKMEEKNFEFYNKLISDKKNILDMGCGYGYLSLFLHYKNEDREITGVDYDEEKIQIAKNVYDKTDNVNFEQADIVSYDFTIKDVIFLNDVLHYLKKEEQTSVLTTCTEKLNSKGLIIIRDGITDLKDRHKTTKLTEWLSTKLIGFNKKANELHFFSSDFIKEFAQKNNLSFEMIEQSKNTSNVLFILRKQ